MRVLLDANIYLSYLFSQAQTNGTIGRLIEAVVLGGIKLLLPEELIAEIETALRSSKKLARRIEPDEGAQFVALLRSVAIIPPPIDEPIPAVVRDPKDDYLLAHALLHEADYLISRDKDLLVIAQVGRLAIVSPHQFVQSVLGATGGE